MRGVTAMDITLLEEFKFRWMGTQGNHCYCATMQSLQNFQGQLLLLRHHAIPADINYFYKYSTTIFIQTTTTSTSTSTSTSTTSTLQLPRTTSKTNYYCFNKIILDLGMTTHTHFFLCYNFTLPCTTFQSGWYQTIIGIYKFYSLWSCVIFCMRVIIENNPAVTARLRSHLDKVMTTCRHCIDQWDNIQQRTT